jgi:hypothetical protein
MDSGHLIFLRSWAESCREHGLFACPWTQTHTDYLSLRLGDLVAVSMKIPWTWNSYVWNQVTKASEKPVASIFRIKLRSLVLCLHTALASVYGRHCCKINMQVRIIAVFLSAIRNLIPSVFIYVNKLWFLLVPSLLLQWQGKRSHPQRTLGASACLKISNVWPITDTLVICLQYRYMEASNV